MSEEPPVIELIDAAVSGTELLSPTRLIEGLNWRVNRGDFWVVGGLPGSGKSDLLATAAGLQRPAAGFHFLFGASLADLPEREQIAHRLRVGMVFQNGGRLFQHLNVAENLALPVCYHRNCARDEARERVEEVLAATELLHLARRRPGTITRNLHPRIALARALALEPEVLLIDNPLLGTDPRESWWWLRFLGELSRGHSILSGRPATLVVTADDFRPWRGQAGRFAIVHHRRWKDIGGTGELEQSPDPALRELLGTGFTREHKL